MATSRFYTTITTSLRLEEPVTIQESSPQGLQEVHQHGHLGNEASAHTLRASVPAQAVSPQMPSNVNHDEPAHPSADGHWESSAIFSCANFSSSSPEAAVMIQVRSWQVHFLYDLHLLRKKNHIIYNVWLIQLSKTTLVLKSCQLDDWQSEPAINRYREWYPLVN